MDQHTLMWDEATRDLQAEHYHTALAYALADLEGVRDFTHLASGPKEYTHRVALTAERVHRVATTHQVPTQDVQEAMDASFRHLLAARVAAAPKPPAQEPPGGAAEPPPPGAPADFATEPPTTAKTSKPHTLPHGGSPAMPTPPPAAPAVPPVLPQATASRAEAIAADIRTMNPHLPEGTIARLAARAVQHLAAEPLAYGNWNDAEDGPWTKKIKQGPGKQKNNQNSNQNDNPAGGGDGAGDGGGSDDGGGGAETSGAEGAAADAGADEAATALLAAAVA